MVIYLQIEIDTTKERNLKQRRPTTLEFFRMRLPSFRPCFSTAFINGQLVPLLSCWICPIRDMSRRLEGGSTVSQAIYSPSLPV